MKNRIKKISMHEIGYITPDWRAISRILGNRVLGRLYIWLFLVPILVYFLKDFPEEIVTSLFGKEFSVRLELPFSWVLLYFGGLMFASAQIVFAIFCPVFINDYKHAGDADEKGITAQKIREIAINYFRLRSSFSRREIHLLKKFVASWGVDIELFFDESDDFSPNGKAIAKRLSEARLVVDADRPGFYRFETWRSDKGIDRLQFIKLTFQQLDRFLNSTGVFPRIYICLCLFFSSIFLFIPFVQGFVTVLGVIIRS